VEPLRPVAAFAQPHEVERQQNGRETHDVGDQPPIVGHVDEIERDPCEVGQSERGVQRRGDPVPGSEVLHRHEVRAVLDPGRGFQIRGGPDGLAREQLAELGREAGVCPAGAPVVQQAAEDPQDPGSRQREDHEGDGPVPARPVAEVQEAGRQGQDSEPVGPEGAERGPVQESPDLEEGSAADDGQDRTAQQKCRRCELGGPLGVGRAEGEFKHSGDRPTGWTTVFAQKAITAAAKRSRPAGFRSRARMRWGHT
jgi:hypothetical protein